MKMTKKEGYYCLSKIKEGSGDIYFEQLINGKIIETQEEWAGKWNKDILTYAVLRGTEDILGNKSETLAMALALTTFAVEIPIKFKRVSIHDNPNLRVEFKMSEDDQMFTETPSVLAYAYFPSQGDVSGKVVFNDKYLWTLNGVSIDNVQTPNIGDTLRTYNLIHVMIHELGHSLGLKHDANSNTKDVMDPYYNGNVLELSDNDISRIRQKYGVRIFKRQTRYNMLKNWLFHRKRRF